MEKLEECLFRYSLLKDPKKHIQPWQFIQYGASILNYFEGNPPENDPSIGGRWVMLCGSSQSLLAILYRLKRWLIALNRTPQKVLGEKDRDSEIVARILSHLLHLPYEILNESTVQEPNTLLVFSDNRLIESPSLEKIQQNQTLFAFNLHWLNHAMWTPDVAGLASQKYYFPWESELRLNPKSQKMQSLPPDIRAPEVIAQEIALLPEDLQDTKFEEILQFYSYYKDYLKGGKKGGKRRLSFRMDSPIPSSYFC